MGEKILLVDDDELVLDCLRRMLSGRFDIETAQGAEEALNAISTRGPYAVLVSDYTMPRLNGARLLEKAREIAPAIVGILVSGNTGSFIDGLIGNPAIFRVLDKPCPAAVLAGVLQDAIARHRELAGTD